MVQIWGRPDRALANAMRDPSGDQLGWPSYAVELVRRVTTPLASVFTKISKLLKVPVAIRLEAIVFPSREEVGSLTRVSDATRTECPPPGTTMSTVLFDL